MTGQTTVHATAGVAENVPLGIAAGMIALPVLVPPEIYPWSLFGCALLVAAALGYLALSPPAASGGIAPSLLILVPLAMAAVLLAPGRARALDESAALTLLLVAGVAGARMVRIPRSLDVVLVSLALLGTLAAVQAVLQHHVLYPQQLELLRSTQHPGSDGLIMRLAAGRPSGPFILPAMLGTFLAISMPPVVALMLRDGRRAVRGGLVAALLLQVYALMLTRSFGAILAAGVATLLVLPLLSRPVRRIAAAAIMVALLAGTGYFLHARRAEIGHAPGSDPISLRLGNWQVAAGMIGDHPLFGVGPGGFATSYTLYMRPGMNETRHAHNTYLEIVACWGMWALVPLGALLIGSASAVRRMVAQRDPRLALAAGGTAFLVHNMIDFGAYLPGVALPATLLIGMVLGSAGDAAAQRSTTGVAWMRLAAASLVVLLLLVIIVPQARSRAALNAARDASLSGDLERAAELAHHAAAVRPTEPDAWAFLAEMTLVHWRDDALRWEAGESASLRSVQLDPGSAIRHYTRALYYLAAGAAGAAYREQAIAHRLFPLKDLYRLPDSPAAGAAP